MVDNGRLSTAMITIVGAIAAVIIADPSVLQNLMGNYYVQYGGAILAVLIALYNVYYPRKEVMEEEGA